MKLMTQKTTTGKPPCKTCLKFREFCTGALRRKRRQEKAK